MATKKAKSNIDYIINEEYFLNKKNIYINMIFENIIKNKPPLINNKNFIEKYNKQIVSPEFINKQKEYIDSLPPIEKLLLYEYTKSFNLFLNNPLSNSIGLTLNKLKILVHYFKKLFKHLKNTISEIDLNNIIITNKDLIKETLIKIIKKIINNAPRLDKKIIVYRGGSYINNITSFSLDIVVADKYVKTNTPFLYRIELDKNIPVLLISVISNFDSELELLLDLDIIKLEFLNKFIINKQFFSIKPNINKIQSKNTETTEAKETKEANKPEEANNFNLFKPLNKHYEIILKNYKGILNENYSFKYSPINKPIIVKNFLLLNNLIPLCYTSDFNKGHKIYKDIIIYDSDIYFYYIFTNIKANIIKPMYFNKFKNTLAKLDFNYLYDYYIKYNLEPNIIASYKKTTFDINNLKYLKITKETILIGNFIINNNIGKLELNYKYGKQLVSIYKIILDINNLVCYNKHNTTLIINLDNTNIIELDNFNIPYFKFNPKFNKQLYCGLNYNNTLIKLITLKIQKK
jgi:hypothetical protein